MMCRRKIVLWIIVISSAFLNVCTAQETCYPPGGVAGIVVATIIVTFVVGALGVALTWRRWTRKTGNQGFTEGQHQKQTHKAQGDFAFDNPYFRDPEGDNTDGVDKNKARSSLNKNSIRSSKISEYSVKTKKPRNSKGHFMFGGGKKHRAYDDSCLAIEPERTVVSLRGHDFTGLGFNICGNMRDGIMVKDVLHRGPANESGLIKAGDKILNVTVSFTNIVYEDALTILSYASPYDVQLEIERIPDKSRSTPSGSKRLGSCSFNNSGQKLFHPLYRSPSIDDLTQIDKDTFPPHSIGPRRSQSIGVAAHKLAAHFKSSDSKLEDKDRNPMSLVLSTTGSLNEKMLANVMSDGNLHKNGLQWEKRFEDTLESEDSSSVSDKRSFNNDVRTKNRISPSISKSASSNIENTSKQLSDNVSHYKQKNSKYLDSPYSNEKLEIHKSPIDKSEIDGNVSVQVHQPDVLSGKRPKSSTITSGALWQMEQSLRNDENPEANPDSPRYTQRSVMRKENLAHPATNRFSQREEGNESDVSKDSLEISNEKKLKQLTSLSSKTKQYPPEICGVSSSTSAINKHFQTDIKQFENVKSTGKNTDFSSKCHSERVYANNIINNSITTHKSVSAINVEQRFPRDITSHQEIKPESVPHEGEIKYSNQREASNQNSADDRSKSNNSDNFSHNFINRTRVTVNGEANQNKNKQVQNSSVPNNPPPEYKSCHRNDSESKSIENKLSPHQQTHVKKTANPAGMFTQINPFQIPSKQKNINLKTWVGRDDMNRESPNHASELQQSRNNYVTISDSTSQQSRRSNPQSESHSYNQRINDRTKTVVMTSYGSSPFSSVNNTQNSNYKQR